MKKNSSLSWSEAEADFLFHTLFHLNGWNKTHRNTAKRHKTHSSEPRKAQSTLEAVPLFLVTPSFDSASTHHDGSWLNGIWNKNGNSVERLRPVVGSFQRRWPVEGRRSPTGHQKAPKPKRINEGEKRNQRSGELLMSCACAGRWVITVYKMVAARVLVKRFLMPLPIPLSFSVQFPIHVPHDSPSVLLLGHRRCAALQRFIL